MLRILSSGEHFRIAPFDQRAAVEFGSASRATCGQRAGSCGDARERQIRRPIVAIGAVEGATTIYSDDEDIAKLAEGRFEVVKIAAIGLSSESAQGRLPFESDQGAPER